MFFRVLFDGLYAAKLQASRALPAGEKPQPPPEPQPPKAERADSSSALQLLALLQREGRLIDFLEEDVAAYADADIGAAARVVHEGCRKAMREHVKLEPVRPENEGARVTLSAPLDASVKLTGNVAGSGPFTGTLRHRGWRAAEVKLPTSMANHDARILAQAEVEL
jgi:hypothetical protein